VNFYDFHIGDYTSRTAHLEPMEDIAYRRMLDLYYTREAPLPLDVEQVARLIRMRGNAEEVRAVLVEFFDQTPEGWRHTKCEEVIQAANAKKQAAKKSADARWAKSEQDADAMRTQCERIPGAMPTQCEGIAPSPSPSPSPSPTTHSSTANAVVKTPRKRGAKFCPEDFEVTAEMRGWACSEFPAVDLMAQTSAFRDWEFKDSKTDWVKAWKNWIRRSEGQAPNARASPQGRPPTSAQMAMAQACPTLIAPHLQHFVSPPKPAYAEVIDADARLLD
jgi:uncharacterized protein YdaU (DUF1376 family)